MPAPSVALLTPQEVVSPRHAPSWLLLALGAGAVNGGAFLACQRFVTHVTGTLTTVGIDVVHGWLLLDYALVVLAFLAGAAGSVLALQGRVARGLRPLFALPLAIVALLLGVVGVAGRAGIFGAIGGPVEEGADFALLSVLAFAMGLLNATVATSTGGAIRATHMTGPATDLGVNLGTALFAAGPARAEALRWAGLRAGKLLSFASGAALMVGIIQPLGWLSFLAPAALVLAAAARTFVPASAVLVPHRSPS